MYENNLALANLAGRRSTRSFTEKQISKEDLETIVKVGRMAPSARNTRQRKFTVVQNPDVLNEIIDTLGKALGREGYNLYGANALIICSDKKDNPFQVEDCACSLENIFLAAHALGIASVWINQFKGVCDVPEVRALLNKLNIPEDHSVFGSAALGYGEIPKEAKFEFSEEIEWIL